jgi:two-component system nitrogen regulation sensor histidine kinase NtrY
MPQRLDLEASSSTFSRIYRKAARFFVAKNLVLALTVASVLSVIVTYFAIARSNHPMGPDPHEVIALILLNLLLLLCLGVLVSRRALGLWRALRKGSAGTQLQTRILILFSLLTITPAVLVSIFAAVFFHFGVQSWFNERINTSLEESVAVAEAYLAEHREIIRSDATAMANDIDLQVHHIIGHPTLLNKIMNQQAALRSLSDGVIVQRNRVVAQTALSFALAFERVDGNKIERAASGDVVVWVEDVDKLRAMVRLNSMPDSYLIVGRLVDEKVLRHVDEATGAVAEYRRLKANLSEIQVQFSLIFGLLVLLLLLAAVWFGMNFAARLVIPITRLIKAAERVRGGDFSSKVPISNHDDEVATLGRAFNRMTEELSRQRAELVEANRQINERRRFSEAVLAGVSAGVLALNRDKQITLYNKRAAQLLPIPENMPLGEAYIWDIVPALHSLLDESEDKAGYSPKEITIHHDHRSRTLMVQTTVERFMDQTEGYILTFDDITDLLVAQRSAAWSDVARRVAHEIKNPLTPIQLSAERLRRKYSKQITEDQPAYLRYIDTISRHVGDIGKIVEEFVAFARMPTPVIQPENLEQIIRKVIFSEQVAHPDVVYEIKCDVADASILGDAQQLARMFTNLLKNAAEALESKLADHLFTPKIKISLTQSNKKYVVMIHDNGSGFPADHLHRLMEPYVTTREKGTGLGLAIVQKIMEDHKGEIVLSNHEEGGAVVTLNFPIDSDKNVTYGVSHG